MDYDKVALILSQILNKSKSFKNAVYSNTSAKVRLLLLCELELIFSFFIDVWINTYLFWQFSTIKYGWVFYNNVISFCKWMIYNE